MSKQIDNYIFGRKLKKGGFGTCYQAKDVKNNKDVCIKEIKIENDDDIYDVENEIEILEKMKSKHSVEVIGYKKRIIITIL